MQTIRDNTEELLDYLKGAVKEVMPTASHDETHDVAMDAYIKLLEKDAAVTHPFTLGYKIAQDLAKDYMRREQGRRDTLRENADEVRKLHSMDADDPAHILEAEQRMKALQKLTPLVRETLEDFYVEGLSIKEIAAKEGASESAIKVRLHRARQEIGE